jgi:signal peptidase I
MAESPIPEPGWSRAIAWVLFLLSCALVATGFEFSVVPTPSMQGTILVGDHILVNKLFYGPAVPFTHIRLPRLKQIARGDIVSFAPPTRPDLVFLKRVAAISGDTVQICGTDVHVDAVRIENVRVDMATRKSDSGACTTYTVPPGRIFVMGDNRRNSEDSRVWGTVPETSVIGEPVLVLWSYSARTSDWLDGNGNLRLRFYLTAFAHLASHTRWSRTGLLL